MYDEAHIRAARAVKPSISTQGTWLPFLAVVLGAKPPGRLPRWLARPLIGEGGVSMMTRIRGGSSAKSRREFGWAPIYPSWRRGFVEAWDKSRP
jgi:hypothetical protein